MKQRRGMLSEFEMVGLHEESKGGRVVGGECRVCARGEGLGVGEREGMVC
jgi:hypothetical protein